MLFLTTTLLLLIAMAFGFSRRPWWQIGALALVCAPLQIAQAWIGDWRPRVGLPSQEPPLDMSLLILIVGWLLLCSYVGYGLGVAYSRWRRVGE